MLGSDSTVVFAKGLLHRHETNTYGMIRQFFRPFTERSLHSALVKLFYSTLCPVIAKEVGPHQT